MVAIKRILDALTETGAYLWSVSIADSFNKEILKADVLKDFTKNVEDAAFKRIALDFKLFEESVINSALACLIGYKIPEMADLLLSDAVYTAKALFETVWIPRQIIIDHQIGVLEVHAFTGCICGDKNP